MNIRPSVYKDTSMNEAVSQHCLTVTQTSGATSPKTVGRVTPASLRAEGIIEIGRAPETSLLFVRTTARLHLIHANWIPDRQLDDYAVRLAVTWIEGHGLADRTVANHLGVSADTLRHALAAAGYQRLGPGRHDPARLAKARAARTFGNRRGRLVRSNATAKSDDDEDATAPW